MRRFDTAAAAAAAVPATPGDVTIKIATILARVVLQFLGVMPQDWKAR